MMRRDPLQMLMHPWQAMRQMLVDPFRMFQMPWIGGELAWNPSFEVRENGDAFVIKADMPGVRNEDVEITLDANELVITGKREQEQEEEEGQFHTYERAYGSFTRRFVLPDSADVDKIRSDLKDGVLTLVVPKKPGTQPQKRKIQVGTGEKH